MKKEISLKSLVFSTKVKPKVTKKISVYEKYHECAVVFEYEDGESSRVDIDRGIEITPKGKDSLENNLSGAIDGFCENESLKDYKDYLLPDEDLKALQKRNPAIVRAWAINF